nr:DNA (cytosine-5-)-methyltransferase [Helicobacter pylori]
MIYIDPPFATNNHFTITNGRATTISNSKNGDIAYSDKVVGMDFIEFLKQRLVLLKELLSEQGSIYVHTDCKIGHYVKVMLDEIFGIQNFRNEITRIKCNPKNFKRMGYGNIKDMILFYSKGKNPIFNEPKIPYAPQDLEKRFPKIDKDKGKNLGLKDPRNFLFLEYIEIVKAIKPEIFIIENVKNLISCAKGYFLEEIKERLNALGYQLSYQILNAKDYGVPQNRERAFIVGASRFSFDFNLLEPSQSVNIQEAISDLAYLCSNEGAFESDYLNPIQSNYQALMRKDSPKLYNHQATNHSQAALEKLKLINKEQGKECLPKNLHGKQQFKSTWGRLNWNKISPTIDTRFDTPSNGTNSHPELHRSITPREAARIQSFSDNYIFYGNKTSVCKQIGNAVPPLLALALGKAILKSLRK